MSAAGATGEWRDLRPVIEYAKCTGCLRCWAYCPEGSVERRQDDTVAILLATCKGCGICAVECAPKAIAMIPEPLEDGA